MGIVDYAARALGYDERSNEEEWFTYGAVTAVTDSTVTVNVGGAAPIEAAKFCAAEAGDVVLLVVMGGRAAAISKRGGDGGGGTEITAGTGLTFSGTTLNHSNAVAAGTVGTSSATSGNTLAVPWVTFDAQGHITAAGTHTHTSAQNLTYYGTCSTAAGTAAKVVSCSDFVLAKGAMISVLFTVANTVAAPTLNVNGTGAKATALRSAATGTSNALYWAAGDNVTFVYDGSYWRAVGNSGYIYSTRTRLASANTTTIGSCSMRHFLATSSMTEGKPMGDGHIIECDWDNTNADHAQLYLPIGPASHTTAWPQWRSQKGGANTWTAWDTFYTEANPPAFSDLTGTAAPTQLPIATASAVGAVKADGTTIEVTSDGTISAVGGGGGTTCTESSWGVAYNTALTWPSNGVGGREEKYSDGRLVRYVWDWFTVSGQVMGNKSISMSGAVTAFKDTPICRYSVRTNGTVAVQAPVNSWSNTSVQFYCYANGSTGSSLKALICQIMTGHWR